MQIAMSEEKEKRIARPAQTLTLAEELRSSRKLKRLPPASRPPPDKAQAHPKPRPLSQLQAKPKQAAPPLGFPAAGAAAAAAEVATGVAAIVAAEEGGGGAGRKVTLDDDSTKRVVAELLKALQAQGRAAAPLGLPIAEGRRDSVMRRLSVGVGMGMGLPLLEHDDGAGGEEEEAHEDISETLSAFNEVKTMQTVSFVDREKMRRNTLVKEVQVKKEKEKERHHEDSPSFLTKHMRRRSSVFGSVPEETPSTGTGSASVSVLGSAGAKAGTKAGPDATDSEGRAVSDATVEAARRSSLTGVGDSPSLLGRVLPTRVSRLFGVGVGGLGRDKVAPFRMLQTQLTGSKYHLKAQKN